MCGRFANGLDWDDYVSCVEDNVPAPMALEPGAKAAYGPRYNVGPRTSHAIVRAASTSAPANDANDYKSGGSNANVKVRLDPMRWGIEPRAGARHGPMINARAESVGSGQGVWAPLVRERQTGVLFVQGFYEFDQTSHAPYFFKFPQGLLALAVLWNEGQTHEQDTFTIITVPAAKWMEPIHDRMPLILSSPEAIGDWLGLNGDPKWKQRMVPLSVPLEHYRVPPEVGNVRNDDRAFTLPLRQRPGGIENMFGRARDKAQKKPALKPESDTIAADPKSVKSESDSIKPKPGAAPGKLTKPVKTDPGAINFTSKSESEQESGSSRYQASKHTKSTPCSPSSPAGTKRPQGLDRFFPSKRTKPS